MVDADDGDIHFDCGLASCVPANEVRFGVRGLRSRSYPLGRFCPLRLRHLAGTANFAATELSLGDSRCLAVSMGGIASQRTQPANTMFKLTAKSAKRSLMTREVNDGSEPEEDSERLVDSVVH